MVGARGTINSPLVILGEGPGAEELKYGTPFCGPSGDLLDKCVPKDFDFDQAYILNAMQCRIKTGKPQKDKDLKTKACAACRQRVLNLIFAHPRRAVLALGAWANGTLLNDYGYKITQRRGEVYGITDAQSSQEIPVVPAVHPAFLLRGGGNIKTFREDVAEAFSLAYDQYTSVRHHTVWEDPEVLLLDSPGAIRTYHGRLINLYRGDDSIEVAADIETSGLNPKIDRILCVGFYRPKVGDDDCAAVVPIYPRYKWNVPDITEDSLEALKVLLNDKRLKFIWQFGKFDEKFFRANKVIPHNYAIVREDTGLLSYALSEATKDHDLDEQAKTLLGAPDHKHALKPWAPTKKDSYEKVPPDVLWDYLAKDVKKTFLIYGINRPKVSDDPHLEKLYTRTLIPASSMLCDVEEYGIHIDWDYVRINRSGVTESDIARGVWTADKKGKTFQVTELDQDVGLEREIILKGEELNRLVGRSINPNSPEDVAHLLYDELELRINNRKPQDTRKETLAKLPSHPAVNLIKEYRSLVKMLGTYVAAIETKAINDRIHTTFKLHVTPTGRLSSSDPNIQNIPRNARYKRMYRSRPGCKLLEADYNSAELRLLAALSGDEYLTGVFLDDKRNLHDEVSVAMYGPDFTDDQRIRAKAVNFGIPYGRDAFSIALEFDITNQEAQRLIDAWFARMPKAADFLRSLRRAAKEGKTLVTVFGRKRRPGVVSQERLKELQNEFCNFHMQSPISDFTLHSTMEMNPKLKKEGAHVVNLIHDATLTEYPDDSVEREQQIAGIVKETMETVPTKWMTTPIKFKVDIKTGTHWGLLTKRKDLSK